MIKKKALLLALLSSCQMLSFAQTNVFPANGNVGIGTLNPAYQLEIRGIMQWGNATNYSFSGEDAGGGFLEHVGDTPNKAILRMQSSRNGDFSSYSQLFIDANKGFSFMTLGNANGNVGIGTKNPQEKLSVNGKIRAHEIKVETSGWPDYVFEEGYKVGTLGALESYIKTHKHLPEIPSAKDAEANGIALGEMNKLLLKKVEELTLHLIEKHQEIKSLKAKDADRQLVLESFAKRLEVLEGRSAGKLK